MSDLLKNIKKKIKALFNRKIRCSDILIITGSKHKLYSQYNHLCNNGYTHITSVSIGKNHYSYNFEDDMIMVISYDIYICK